MGITGPFWEALRSVQSPVRADDLEDKWLAIDLSAWLVEADKSEALKAVHAHPHLFIVFSRAVALLRLKCRLIGVLEGAAHPNKKSQSRKALDEKGASARLLLQALGIPVVEAPGEAEATAAALNAVGLADGVISEDGDALLYGATAVYRGLTCEALDRGMATKYDISGHEVFGLGSSPQRDVVAFALLVGTDIHHTSAPNIGVAKALTFLKHCALTAKVDALSVLERWRDDRPDLKTFRLAFLQNANRETQTICTNVWRHFAATAFAFPDETLVANYVDTNAKLPADLRRASAKLSVRQPAAKALYFANAKHPVFGRDVGASWLKLRDALLRGAKPAVDHGVGIPDPDVLREEAANQPHASLIAVFCEPDFRAFSPTARRHHQIPKKSRKDTTPDSAIRRPMPLDRLPS